ncbi:MAG: hypothetical protein ACI92Z_003550 [Paracoccaceae bacterium]|jgi:hypothetical protein
MRVAMLFGFDYQGGIVHDRAKANAALEIKHTPFDPYFLGIPERGSVTLT